MRLDQIVAALLLASLLLLAATGSLPAARGTTGPRGEDLVIHFYSNVTEAYLGLKAGDVDLVLEDLPKDLATLAREDSNLVLAPVAGYNMYEFDLNNNWSIPSYPGIRSPMNYSQMRQAVAWLTDKNHIVDVICDGFAERIDQAIAAPLKGWANMSMWYPNYPYEYDPFAAKAVLDSTFPEGTTPNPYYDPSFPGSALSLRTYPADHSLAGQDLDPVKICVRSDVLYMLKAGRLVYGNMRKHGIPCDVREGPSSAFYSLVLHEFNYHFYTGGWKVGRFPSMTLYSLYHSDNIGPLGGNYVTGVRPGVPTHPKLDRLLKGGRWVDSYSEAVTNTKLAAGYMTEICVTVPLYSLRSYYSYSSKLLGVVNMEGHGLENDYTFMNAYRTEGGPIRCATINPPSAMNIIYSNWIYDWQCLDRMNLFSGVAKAPYNPVLDMAGFTRDWETTTWDDGGTPKTKLAMSFRSDGYFVKPVSGDLGRNVNATHYFASAWYYLQSPEWWGSSDFWDLHHIDITGPYSVEIYFDTYSYWNTYLCQGFLLPVDTWAQHDELITIRTETSASQTTPSLIELDAPIWIEYVTFNGLPLTMLTDYNLVNAAPGTSYGNAVLSIYSSLGTGELEVKYWAITSPANGYTPANLPWQDIFEGAGMYYATDFAPGAGGYLALKRNPFYYMDTPLLGDIDFVRKPTGAFKVDIFDLAIAGAAYGSQGVEFPSRNWFPGADLAPSGGVVDIFDLVTVAGTNWDREYDFPE